MANPYFNAEYYLARNPDVFAAGINTAEAAWEHYVNFGAAEALNGASTRKPAPWFDISYYYSHNTDLSTAGLTAGQMFDHFVNFGIEEGRQPSAEAVLTEANLLAYAKANEDLMEAFGIAEDASELTEEQAQALAHQFYAFGYKEDRADPPFDISEDDPAAGGTFTLTAGTDFANQSTAFINNSIPSDFKFTSANEVVESLDSTMGAADTLLDGSTSDNDTLNLRVGANTTALALGTVQNIENIELIMSNAGTANPVALNLASVTGLKTLKASGTVNAASNGVTITNAGATGATVFDFSGITTTGANGAVNLAMGTTTPSAALTITGGAGNDTLTGGSGDDVMNGGAGNDTLNAGAGNNTIDLGAGSGAQFATFSNGDNTVASTGATGAITVTGGNGNNTVELSGDGIHTVTLGAGDNTVTTGGGNDVITLGGGANTVTSGAGNDTITVGNGANTIVAGAGNDTIQVGTGNNTITGGTGADAITLTVGAGNNLIITGSSDTAARADALTAADVIFGFTTNGDQLSFGLTDGTATNTLVAANTDAAGTTIAAMAAAAELALTAGTTQYVLWEVQAGDAIIGQALVSGAVAAGDSFLFADRDLDGTLDQVIVLDSVGVTTFAATDIIA